MTASEQHEAHVLLTEIVSVAHSRNVVAYTFRGCDDPAIFVNLPVGDLGPVHGWVGFWHSVEDQRTGVSPHTVIATAPEGQLGQLRVQVEQSHRLPHIGEMVRDGNSVVIASSESTALTKQLDRVSDVEPLLNRWLELASS